MENKLIVMSIDGLVWEDMKEMTKHPIWKKYFSHACGVRQVTSIYPTITYPCHSTMCTGVWPDKHGVTGNLVFCPGKKNVPWKWFRKYNQWTDDLFYAAKRKGKTTAAVFWPVTGNHPAIDYLIAEYWPQSDEDTAMEAFARSGSSEEVLKIIERNIDGVTIRKHPETDDFIVRCACQILKENKPDLLMLHPGQVDGYRHEYGVFNDKTYKGVEEALNHLEQFMKILEEENLTDVYNLVITSDHGLIDITKQVNVNVLLKDKGLIRVDEKGNWLSWDACCISGGASALVYIKPDADKKLYLQVKELLEELAKDKSCGISEVITREQAARQHHLDGDFSFVLETDGTTEFGNSATGELIIHYSQKNGYGKGNHGYLPEKGPQPVLAAIGPDFKKDVWLEHAFLVDEAPTFAEVLGLELNEPDGRVLTEILETKDRNDYEQ